ncbi:MAG: ABC transporter substrate-binding protein [Chloroflexi bacterium]|nr:ABC transporter substrate-binding protein [Chloroflexota bacterium]
MEYTASFGYWIRRQRKTLDLTQADLARQVGCAPVTIKKIERDERRPSRQMAERLADCLAIPPDERETFIQCGLAERPADALALPRQPTEILETVEAASVPAFFEATAPERVGGEWGRFVGRERELERLAEYLAAALAGNGQVVFVTGEAGHGKTALLAEFARRAHVAQPELIVACGYCNAYAGPGDPYLPFRDVMEMLTGDVEIRWAGGIITREQARRLWTSAPSTVKILREIGPDLLDLLVSANTLRQQARLQPLVTASERPTGHLEQHQVFEQVTRVLQLLAHQRPLLLLLDDLQWADATSISLLFHLGRRLRGSRILIVGAYRPSEVALGRPAAEPEHRQQHALEPIINEFRRHFGDIQIDLARFEPAKGRELVDALLDREPNHLSETFRTALFWQTKGHPLFTIELIREMQARGDLIQDETGHWVIREETLNWATLPARVEAVIEQRLGRLDETLCDLLAAASVEGESFTVEVVARVQQMSQRQALRCLSQELEKRHRLVRERAAIEVDRRRLCRYQFAHVLFQHYLYRRLSQGERILLHAEVAQALEELYEGQTGLIAVQLAHHYVEAGHQEKAIHYLLQAGDKARTLYAHQEAISHYQQALVFLRETGQYEQATRTLMKLGLTYHLNFDFERSHQAYEEGFLLWRRARDIQPEPTRRPPAPHALRLNWRDPGTLDPTRPLLIWSVGLAHQLFSGLVALNAELDVAPDVAHSWEVSDGGCTYIFHLRDDVSWSDGTPVTAGDFEYAWKRALDPAGLASFAGALLCDVKGANAFRRSEIADPDQVAVRALDAITLRVELEGPTNYFPHLLAFPTTFPVPRHVVEKYGEAWAEAGHIVTNGPFRLEDWRREESMALRRNPTYHDPWRGNVERIELALGTDPATLLQMYEANAVDLLHLHVLPASEMDRARQWHTADYISGPQLLTNYVCFTQITSPPFSDARLRQALALAVDKEKLANVTLRGYVYPATGGFIPPGIPGHTPGAGLPFDPERARQLLADAGYLGGRGFPVVEALNSPFSEPFAKYLQTSWREHLGIEIPWQTLSPTIINERLVTEPPNLATGLWVADYPDPDCYLRVCVEMDKPKWDNAAYWQLVEKARRVTDHTERMRLYAQAERLLAEDAALVSLTYGRVHLLLKPWIKGYQLSTMKGQFWKDVIIEPH